VVEADFYAKTGDDDDEDDDDDDDEEGADGEKKKKNKAYIMDPDHRLLLRCAQPLLHSRNSGVILAVTQLYALSLYSPF
jgi:AP-3 complex subunit beta